MNAKILSLCLIVASLLTLTSCKKECKPEIRYVDRVHEVKIPVKCVVPDVNCSFDRGSYTEVVGAMWECIVEMKRANEVCR